LLKYKSVNWKFCNFVIHSRHDSAILLFHSKGAWRFIIYY